MKRTSTMRRLITFALAAAASHRHLEADNLSTLPLLDRSAVKAPITANPETREAALPEQTIDRGGMDTEVFRELLDGEDIVPSGPHLGQTV
jgi:hypothetical protein